MAGIYVHIPFCSKKCPYCDFVSFASCEVNLVDAYEEALIREVSMRRNEAESLSFDTIYIGGGTPSLFPAESVVHLLETLNTSFRFSSPWNEMEISVEANPESITSPWLHKIRSAGVNRISIGVQDFTERGLRVLERPHSLNDAYRALSLALDAGFESVSIDLMFGIPGQSMEELEKSLEAACSCGVHHISCYELTLEPGTGLARMVADGSVSMPDDELSAAMTDLVESYLQSKGFCQYEISNFALPGHECRHNLNYWENGSYLGLGCAAVSYLEGVRTRNSSDLGEYVQAVSEGRRAVEFQERLDDDARFRESVVLGLRMSRGVSARKLEQEFGVDVRVFYKGMLERLTEGRLIACDGDRIMLTQRGRRIANAVMSELV